MLELAGTSIRYGAVRAVQDVSLTVAAGETVALVGANGAGKSSILKAVLGLAPATGRIAFTGQDLAGVPTHRRVALGIALSPEGRQVFPEMTVAENLALGHPARGGAAQAARARELVALFPRLQERMAQKAGRMSGGEQQMLAIARALMSSPKLLMLDEPTLGLAPIIVDELIALLAQLARNGLAILLAEQNAEMALVASSRAYVLETGIQRRQGPSRELMGDPAIRNAYLGL